LSWYGFSSE